MMELAVINGGMMGSPVVTAFGYVILTILIALLSYGVVRTTFLKANQDVETDLAGSVVIRLSSLHGLILALVFAQELGNLHDIDETASREAEIVSDTFYDLERYDADATVEIRTHLARYVQIVLEQEWDSLANTGTLQDAAWQAWDSAYAGILSLTPQTARQEQLRDIMLNNIRDISGLRRERENAGLSGVHGLFIIAAVVGVVLTSAGFFNHPPTAPNIFLLSVFALYSGLILFFIVAFANPYHAPGRVAPIAFERVFTTEVQDLATRPPAQ